MEENNAEITFPSIQKALHTYRNSNQLSWASISKSLGVHKKTLKEWRDGHIHPRGKYLEKLKSNGIISEEHYSSLVDQKKKGRKPMVLSAKAKQKIKAQRRAWALRKAMKEANPEPEKKRTYTRRLPDLDRVQLKTIGDQLERFVEMMNLPYMEFLQKKDEFIRELVQIVLNITK